MNTKRKNKSVKTAAKQPDMIVAKIVSEFKDRTRAEIRKWRQALELAGDINTPRLYLIQDLYDNLKDDGHFISQVELRKAATLCSPFSIIDRATGEVNEEKTKLFKTEWFYNFMEDVLESPCWNCPTLLQCSSVSFRAVISFRSFPWCCPKSMRLPGSLMQPGTRTVLFMSASLRISD